MKTKGGLMETEEKYLKRIKEYTEIKAKLDKSSNLLSTVRLLVFLGGTAITILAFIYLGMLYGFITLVLALVAFIYFVIKHQKVIDEANRYNNLIEINKKCISRMDGTWTKFPDDGQDYVNATHTYSGDLDIFGRASLFQWINSANTYYGRKFLRTFLENPNKDIVEIKKRQNAIRELAVKLDFCQGLQCEGLNVSEFSKDPEELLKFSENKTTLFRKKWLSYIFYILPEITLASIIICFFDRTVSVYIPFTLVIVQAIINLTGFRSTTSILNTISGYKNKIKVFQKLLTIIEKESFKDEYLTELKAELYRKNKSACSQIKGLEGIVNAVDLKYNPVFYFIANILLFWNFHCVFALESWNQRSGTSLRTWLNTIGKFEALSSLAGISQINPEWANPEFVENKVIFSAFEMGHPLIVENKRICNSIKLKDQICIVTGSNMSGKTTLLRAIGINLVLAYAGAPVCAKKFESSILDIYTSMRLNDDLNSGISTFYAELLRIKMIINYSKEKQPMLFLIDEVFRGTNSKDRVIGAKNVILNLNKSWILGLMSTHDFELCELEKDKSGRIINYHFTETYSENAIRFDYKLRSGRCNTTNAKYLMRMAGIEILEDV
jgi:DNA mismatch repair ATPase MutS